MRLKTYRAKNMADALVAVKKDLGKDAVILHTRMFRSGGFLGFGSKAMVEVTASDDARIAPSLKIKDRAAPPAKAAARPTLQGMIAAGDDERALAAGSARPQREPTIVTRPVAGAYGPRMVPTSESDSGVEAKPSSTVKPQSAAAAAMNPGTRATDAAPMPMSVHNRRGTLTIDNDQATPIREAARLALDGPAADVRGVAAELAVIRRMVGQVLQTSAMGGAPALKMSDALVKHYTRLIENEVAQEVADEIVAGVRDELTPAELLDDGIVRASVLRRIETLLPVCENITAPGKPEDGRPLTIALVGPTGVGKTTTIAKLAAAYRLRHAKRVTLITCDTYRIAAVDQLRTYANIIGVPLRVVMNPEEMKAAVEGADQSDVVLIDTAGRSPADATRLDELNAFIAAAKPHQTHLVLSSVSGQTAMLRTVERFGALKPNLVIFTKLDEAANLGVLVNVARRVDARLSYVTTGQEVPDDIEPGRADRLARLVLDGKSKA